MLKDLMRGAIAGAAGTTALNLTTYLDMTVRARSGSSVPATLASRLANTLGVNLAADNADETTRQNRASGVGALLGIATGVGVGAVYGLLRSRVGNVPRSAAGVGLGIAAMAGSDVPATLLGVTNPKTWSRTSWLSDIIPHLVYGFVTAIAFDIRAGR